MKLVTAVVKPQPVESVARVRTGDQDEAAL